MAKIVLSDAEKAIYRFMKISEQLADTLFRNAVADNQIRQIAEFYRNEMRGGAKEQYMSALIATAGEEG